MELAGRLDKYDFADLLQMLASSEKSGKLTLTEYGGQGVVVLRQGKIIYAASSSARETLGNMLLHKGLIDEEQLKRCLEEQQNSTEERRLGTILVERGYLSQEDLEGVITTQIEKVVSEILGWNAGFFRFESFELPNRGEVEVDARVLHGGSGNLLLSEGLPPSRLLLEMTGELDEAAAGRSRDDEKPAQELPRPPQAGEGPPRATETGRLGSLRSIMAEFHSPAFTGEGTLLILNYAQRLVRRGVLFSMTALGARGLGQFGVEPPEGATPEFVRQLSFPTDTPSIFTEVVARKGLFLGALEKTPTNVRLLEELGGGGWPDTVLAAPLIVAGRTLLVLYGDNLPDNDPIGPVDELEVVMIHAALAMEKSLLAKRLEHLEEVERRSSEGKGESS